MELGDLPRRAIDCPGSELKRAAIRYRCYQDLPAPTPLKRRGRAATGAGRSVERSTTLLDRRWHANLKQLSNHPAVAKVEYGDVVDPVHGQQAVIGPAAAE
jgi:hypothetical protein